MRVIGSIMIVAFVFGAAGCDDDPAEAEESRSFALNSINQSGVSGTAVITDDAGDNSTVEVTLTGLEANSGHAGHVHTGSCSNQGGVVFGLEPITADAGGSGSAVTASVPDNQLTTDFYIQYHVDLDPPGAAIACGDIPAAE